VQPAQQRVGHEDRVDLVLALLDLFFERGRIHAGASEWTVLKGSTDAR
jgi:hypothetical protein